MNDGCAAILVLLGCILALIFFGYRSEIATDIVRFEQLRIDAKDVDSSQAEDVIGQITQANQRIASLKYWNDWIFIELLIPDRIDTLSPIPVPKRTPSKVKE